MSDNRYVMLENVSGVQDKVFLCFRCSLTYLHQLGFFMLFIPCSVIQLL